VFAVLAGLALLDFAMFFDVLFLAGSQVLGHPHTDLARYFLPSRIFGFGELAKGHLPLWNPHIFAGIPYFGGMQSALLYPPNWLFLVLPVAAAANWTIAFNVWLLGASMAAWALYRGLQPLSAFTGAALLTFCAPHFLHVYGGHATLMAAMAWSPLVFLAIDGWLDTRRPLWCLVGMFAVALQIYAGSPQHVYVIAIAASAYAVLRLGAPIPQRIAAAAGLLGIYAGGALLAAVQLLTSMDASAATIRGQRLPIHFAATVNFPPESLVTLFAPGFFGDVTLQPYWGRWYLWETCAFVGVCGLTLAVHGMARRAPGNRPLLMVAAACLVLALGAATPLFGLLYEHAPLFDKMRGTAKFLFPCALVLTLFAGYGLDRIGRERVVPRLLLWAAGGATFALAAAATVVRMVDWAALMSGIPASQSYAGTYYGDQAARSAAQAFASNGLMVAALTAGVAGALVFAAGRRPRARYLLAALAVAEVFAFARLHRPTFDADRVIHPELRAYLAERPGDYRTLNVEYPNSAMSMGTLDAWGYDPFVARRYAEFMTWSVGDDASRAIDDVAFKRFHPLLSMLRVQYVVTVRESAMIITTAQGPPLQRLELIGAYQVQHGRDAILQAMEQPSFDPRKEVILEQPPEPVPIASGAPGRAAIAREGTDFVEIVAEIASPAILLMTDAWAPGWRAFAVEGGAVKHYAVMPANYALRAIALDRGRHYIRMEYSPAAFRVGMVISVAAWIAWCAAILSIWRYREG